MRLELGVLTVEVEHHEDAAALLRGMLRHLNNVEVAELLGVTDKTVRRWKREGRLPHRDGSQIMLLDLLQHFAPAAGKPAALPEGAVVQRARHAGAPAGTDAAPEYGGELTAPGNRRPRPLRPRASRSSVPGSEP